MEAFFAITLIILILRWWWRAQEPSPPPNRNRVQDRWERKARKAERARDREAQAKRLREEGFEEELIAVILPTIDK